MSGRKVFMTNTTTEYGLTVASVSALSCQALSIELFNIMDSIRQGNKSAWEIAKAYSRIVNEELFEDDFDTLKEFAEYVGVSPATITQYCKAVAFIEGQPDMNEDTVSVGSAYLLSTLGEHLGEFVTWLEEQGINLLTLSVAGLKELMKQFKHKDEEPTEETEEEQDSNEQDDIEDAETEEIDKEGVIMMIIQTMKNHDISIEDIQAYMS